jgi:hypothetical protein
MTLANCGFGFLKNLFVVEELRIVQADGRIPTANKLC